MHSPTMQDDTEHNTSNDLGRITPDFLQGKMSQWLGHHLDESFPELEALPFGQHSEDEECYVIDPETGKRKLVVVRAAPPMTPGIPSEEQKTAEMERKKKEEETRKAESIAFMKREDKLYGPVSGPMPKHHSGMADNYGGKLAPPDWEVGPLTDSHINPGSVPEFGTTEWFEGPGAEIEDILDTDFVDEVAPPAVVPKKRKIISNADQRDAKRRRFMTAEIDNKQKREQLQRLEAAKLEKLRVETLAQQEAKRLAEQQAEAEAEAQAKADAVIQEQAKAKAKAEAEAEAEAEAKAKADDLVKMQAQAKAKADAEAQEKADALIKQHAQAQAKAEAQEKDDAQASQADRDADEAEKEPQHALERQASTAKARSHQLLIAALAQKQVEADARAEQASSTQNSHIEASGSRIEQESHLVDSQGVRDSTNTVQAPIVPPKSTSRIPALDQDVLPSSHESNLAEKAFAPVKKAPTQPAATPTATQPATSSKAPPFVVRYGSPVEAEMARLRRRPNTQNPPVVDTTLVQSVEKSRGLVGVMVEHMLKLPPVTVDKPEVYQRFKSEFFQASGEQKEDTSARLEELAWAWLSALRRYHLPGAVGPKSSHALAWPEQYKHLFVGQGAYKKHSTLLLNMMAVKKGLFLGPGAENPEVLQEVVDRLHFYAQKTKVAWGLAFKSLAAAQGHAVAREKRPRKDTTSREGQSAPGQGQATTGEVHVSKRQKTGNVAQEPINLIDDVEPTTSSAAQNNAQSASATHHIAPAASATQHVAPPASATHDVAPPAPAAQPSQPIADVRASLRLRLQQPIASRRPLTVEESRFVTEVKARQKAGKGTIDQGVDQGAAQPRQPRQPLGVIPGSAARVNHRPSSPKKHGQPVQRQPAQQRAHSAQRTDPPQPAAASHTRAPPHNAQYGSDQGQSKPSTQSNAETRKPNAQTAQGYEKPTHRHSADQNHSEQALRPTAPAMQYFEMRDYGIEDGAEDGIPEIDDTVLQRAIKFQQEYNVGKSGNTAPRVPGSNENIDPDLLQLSSQANNMLPPPSTGGYILPGYSQRVDERFARYNEAWDREQAQPNMQNTGTGSSGQPPIQSGYGSLYPPQDPNFMPGVQNTRPGNSLPPASQSGHGPASPAQEYSAWPDMQNTNPRNFLPPASQSGYGPAYPAQGPNAMQNHHNPPFTSQSANFSPAAQSGVLPPPDPNARRNPNRWDKGPFGG